MDLEFFVKNIKFYCSAKGVKPTVACREAGVGQSFINNMELKGSVPSVEKVEMLAHYLGVTVSELIGEVSNPNALSDLPPDARAVAEAYVSASADDRLIVDTVLKKYKL